jgi:hypothetical protein
MLNALFGVAHGLQIVFFTRLAAPNLAPKTELPRHMLKRYEMLSFPDNSWERRSYKPSGIDAGRNLGCVNK